MNTETTFVNISDRYGDEVTVTVADYEELNPQATFEVSGNELIEYDSNGDFVEVVAERF